LAHQACHDVGGTTGRKSDNDAHRPRRIGLRPSKARHGRERGSARCQMQKLPSVGKFHSITRSARTSIMSGMAMPSVFAVRMLIDSKIRVLAVAGPENARGSGVDSYSTKFLWNYNNFFYSSNRVWKEGCT
jgi:hypothetical protein